MTKPNWIFGPIPKEEEINFLIKALKIDYSLAYLLTQREINTYEKAKDFFSPSLEKLHDPFLMKGMKKALERILKAIENQEKICIYGDYDVDGITSVAILFKFLSLFTKELICYIPDRQKEGYGISTLGIDYALKKGVSLLIALDCGIRDVDKIFYAKEKNIEIIICDHHLPGEKIPEAFAVLDPKQKDCPYPFKELSGCGVTFKLIQAIVKEKKLDQKYAYCYLDLVALSIAADIVPVLGENRILAFYGLLKINKKPSLGLEVFKKEIKKEMDISDLVFSIAPKINAAGRIKHAKYALKLLLSNHLTEAEEALEEILDLNLIRKNLDKKFTLEALEAIEENGEKENFSTVLFSPYWHKGVIGIMASRLIETYYRPTIIFTESEGRLVGSARSVEGFDLYSAIEKCAKYIDQFGGHRHAAGLSIKKENFSSFKKAFEKVCTKSLLGHAFLPPLKIDSPLDFKEITPKFLRIIKRFGPFGPGNMRPVFYSKNLKVKKENIFPLSDLHLKIKTSQEGFTGDEFSSIGFYMGKYKEKLKENKTFAMIYSIKENHWRENISWELFIKDMYFN